MNLSDKIGEAVKIRESGKLSESKKLFEALLAQIDKDDPDYLRLAAEYVIQLRLESKALASQALKLGQELLDKHPSEPTAIRSLAHSLIDLGEFELAEPLFHTMITAHANNSLKQGEEQAHLAYVHLRTGKVASAKQLISKAISNIKQNTAKEDYLEVRESYAYLVKSLIEIALGQKPLAQQSANTAMDIAKRGNSPFRIAQAKEVLRLFDPR